MKQFDYERVLPSLVAPEIMNTNRDEREILGYRYVLDMIHESYAYIDVSPNGILQLHRDLYRYLNVPFAGHWKTVEFRTCFVMPG